MEYIESAGHTENQSGYLAVSENTNYTIFIVDRSPPWNKKNILIGNYKLSEIKFTKLRGKL